MAVLPPLTRRYSSEFHQTVQRSFSAASTSPFSKKSIRRFSSEFQGSRITTTSPRNPEDHLCRIKPADCFNSRNEHSYRDISSPVFYASESDSSEQHHKLLDTYFDSLQTQPEPGSSKATSENTDVGHMNVTKQKSVYTREYKSSSLIDVKDSANLYLISILVSLNIAVFLFEIASPVQNSDGNLWSLPMMYGAKVNDLIMLGEWWRLLTPMFLHAGVLHIGLSSWVLLSFGPQVCKGYGAFTFFLIYMLGGISGNFISFLHTSDPTVGGSGPAFAIIGAWLIYQSQNKDITVKQDYESMFQKAIIATASTFVLANFGPIDNWTSLGAAISGIIYGFFTSPVVQLDNASGTGEGKEEMMRLIREPANPCKSVLIFTVIVSVFGSLLLFLESPLGILELEELAQIVE